MKREEIHWGSPLDRAGEALAMHETKLDPAIIKTAWRDVHPDVRAGYIEKARVVLDASGVIAALRPWLKHHPACHMAVAEPCSCGLDDALATTGGQ